MPVFEGIIKLVQESNLNKAIVIGAGIGGIAIAARLAKNGFDVTVFEKNPQPGGRMNKIQRDGFLFDTGPTLFLMPEIFAETYNALGQHIEDHLELIRLDPTYRVYLHDKTTIDLTADLNNMRLQLDAMEPGSFEAYLRFLSEGYRHYNLSLKHFVGRNFINLFEFFNPKNIPLIFSLKALTTHYKNISKYFKDQRL
ncbi:FAD-dependent oxidoreductase, partial [Candidatus Poribacteria bacterium]|nr:FAD-dependent oxidoreductase [Candidatus Poribacteria bacterium]